MANQSKLKAWVRYDGTGRVISGGPIFQVNKPKVGNWKQIDANLCCNGTTGTTTTQGGGGTPTAFIQSYFLNTYNACNSTYDGSLLFYSASTTIQAGISVFTDAALTIPVTAGYVISTSPQPMQFVKYLVDAEGVLSEYTCTPVPASFTGYIGSDLGGACTQTGGYPSATLYADPGAELGVNTRLFVDGALTIPYSGQFGGQYYNVNGIVYQIGSAFGGQGYIISVLSCG